MNKTILRTEPRCFFCNRTADARPCQRRKHFFLCDKCHKKASFNPTIGHRLRTLMQVYPLELVSKTDDECVVHIKKLFCCQKLSDEDVKEIKKIKPDICLLAIAKCKECGSTPHKTSCSRYKDLGKCKHCGYSLRSNRHAKDCPLYKPCKKPTPCQECGGTTGHKHSCSKFNVKPCSECHSFNSHKDSCSRSRGKCNYCGYSLRSNYHAKTCPLFDEEKDRLRKQHFEQTCMERFGVRNPYFYQGWGERLIELASSSPNSVHISSINRQLAKELNDYGVKTQFEFKLGDHRFDLLTQYKEKKLLVEYNPSISHNLEHDFLFITGRSNVDKGGLSRRYHLDNSILAEQNGFEVIQYFEHYDHDKMIEFILSKLGLNKHVCYARKCQVKLVDPTEARKFICENHLLGLNKKAEVNLGLYKNNELFSIVAFSHLKDNGINRDLTDNNIFNSWELVRFCNKRRCSVVGGAARLQKHFIETYKPSYIKTLSDFNLGNGTLYKQLGYQEIGHPSPSIFWTKVNSQIFINNNRVLLGADRVLKNEKDYFPVGLNEQDFISRGGLDVYGKFPTNQEIMLHYGYVRVADCGYKTWILKVS